MKRNYWLLISVISILLIIVVVKFRLLYYVGYALGWVARIIFNFIDKL